MPLWVRAVLVTRGVTTHIRHHERDGTALQKSGFDHQCLTITPQEAYCEMRIGLTHRSLVCIFLHVVLLCLLSLLFDFPFGYCLLLLDYVPM